LDLPAAISSGFFAKGHLTAVSNGSQRGSPPITARVSSPRVGRLSHSSAITVEEDIAPVAAAQAHRPSVQLETTVSAAPAHRTDAPAGKRTIAISLAAGIAVLAAASYSHFTARAPAPISRVDPKPAHRATFSLTIESTPSGAQVMEGTRVLGSTPLSIRVDAASVAGAPRELWLQREGHVPYRVLQGPSKHDVHLSATLSSLRPQAAPVAAAATAEVEAAPAAAADRRRPIARKRSVPRAEPAKAAEPAAAPGAGASDIRLER
jgi:hypothetical protein